MNRSKTTGLTDYGVYELTRRQYVLAVVIGCACCFTAGYLFYRSFAAALLLAGFGAFFPRFVRSGLLRKRRDQLKVQFKEALFSLSSSLAAGRSVENAFAAVLEDLKLMYPDPATDILQEFALIRTRMQNGEPLEQSLKQFSVRAKIDDITHFADVLTIAKRSGGDLVDVIRRTSRVIGEKLEVQQEITVMVAQKRFETRVMMAVPFVFMAFLTYAAPDYMAPLYQGAGYLILTLALVVLAGCFWLIHKIMSIGI
jgi:tight adherence protein B